MICLIQQKEEKLNQTEVLFANHLQEMLDSSMVENRFSNDFQKYIDMKYIYISKFYLTRKNKKAALEMLNNVKLMHYKADKFYLMLFTKVLPVTIYSTFVNTKQNMKQQIKKIIYKT